MPSQSSSILFAVIGSLFLILSRHQGVAFVPGQQLSSPSFTVSSSTTTELKMGLFDGLQKSFKSLFMRADASHILIKVRTK